MTYWARQQNMVSEDTNNIAELIRSGTPFQEWDPIHQQLLSCALFPEKVSDAGGRWTIEGRQALNLLRHLVKNGRFINAPEALKAPAAKMAPAERTDIAMRVFKVRLELITVTPAFTLQF